MKLRDPAPHANRIPGDRVDGRRAIDENAFRSTRVAVGVAVFLLHEKSMQAVAKIADQDAFDVVNAADFGARETVALNLVNQGRRITAASCRLQRNGSKRATKRQPEAARSGHSWRMPHG